MSFSLIFVGLHHLVITFARWSVLVNHSHFSIQGEYYLAGPPPSTVAARSALVDALQVCAQFSLLLPPNAVFNHHRPEVSTSLKLIPYIPISKCVTQYYPNLSSSNPSLLVWCTIS